MGKSDRAKALFSMYEGIISESPADCLKVAVPDVTTETMSEMFNENGGIPRAQGYTISEVYPVPNGKYRVNVKMRSRLEKESTHHPEWYVHLNGAYAGKIRTDKAGWDEKESGWLGNRRVKNGELEISLKWCPAYHPGYDENVFIDWVEFQYEKVD